MKYVIAVIEGYEAGRRGIDRMINRGITRLQNSEESFAITITIAIVVAVVVSAGIFGLNYYTGTLR